MAGYGTDEQFTQWLLDNGYIMPDGAPSPAVLRQRGSQYIDAVYGDQFIGRIATFDQERAWPRIGASLRGTAIPTDVVPQAVIYASFIAAYEDAINPGSLNVVGSVSGAVTREKVGELEVQYAGPQPDGAVSLTPLISTVDGMLAPYLRDLNASCVFIRSVG
nr:MAG TPA: Putative Head Tail Connector Protein [Caudoviricetes sp.]